jgi:hypothetical protein
VIAEGTNTYLFAEACLLGFGFEGLDLIAEAMIAFFVLPLGFVCNGLVEIGTPAQF